MNSTQYHSLGWCFLAFGIILIYLHMNFLMPTLWIFVKAESAVTTGGVYQAIKTALVYVMIILSYFLFVVFHIMGWLEKRK